MARKTYFKGKNIRFMQGGGGEDPTFNFLDYIDDLTYDDVINAFYNKYPNASPTLFEHPYYTSINPSNGEIDYLNGWESYDLRTGVGDIGEFNRDLKYIRGLLSVMPHDAISTYDKGYYGKTSDAFKYGSIGDSNEAEGVYNDIIGGYLNKLNEGI